MKLQTQRRYTLYAVIVLIHPKKAIYTNMPPTTSSKLIGNVAIAGKYETNLQRELDYLLTKIVKRHNSEYLHYISARTEQQIKLKCRKTEKRH